MKEQCMTMAKAKRRTGVEEQGARPGEETVVRKEQRGVPQSILGLRRTGGGDSVCRVSGPSPRPMR